MDYNKRPLDYPDQISILKQRGLIINDSKYAMRQLRIISYFRLASYWRPMEADKTAHTFKPGSTFENAISLYYFDKQLRALLFTLIQSLEIALRTKIIHHVSMRYGAFWFTDSSLCANTQRFVNNLSYIQAELNRSKEDFIQEHYTKYSTPQFPPVWKTLEVVSFGTLSKLFENLSDCSIKKIISAEFNLPHRKFLESWIKCASVMRNAIAHHSRIWNRKFPYKPIIPKTLPCNWINTLNIKTEKLYPQLCILKYLEDAIHPKNDFANDLKNLINSHTNVDIAAMGFPEDWQQQPLWKTEAV